MTPALPSAAASRWRRLRWGVVAAAVAAGVMAGVMAGVVVVMGCIGGLRGLLDGSDGIVGCACVRVCLRSCVLGVHRALLSYVDLGLG